MGSIDHILNVIQLYEVVQIEISWQIIQFET